MLKVGCQSTIFSFPRSKRGNEDHKGDAIIKEELERKNWCHIIIFLDRTDAARPVARIVGEPKPAPQPRRLGTLKGAVLYVAPDFDAPLDDFKEYME
jgi:hypothetical protein